MFSLPPLGRSRPWAALSLLVLGFLLPPLAAHAQYPGGGSGGGYPGGGSSSTGSWQVSDSNNGTWSDTSPSYTPPDGSGPWTAGSNGCSFGGSDDRNGNIQGTVTTTLTWVPAAGQTM